jgi:hypothetical protein
VNVAEDGSSAEDEPSGASKHREAEVGNDEVLYRMLFPTWVSIDKITGLRRPSSAAFKPDEDGISVYREEILIRDGLNASDLTRNADDPVVSFTVADVRSLSLDVREDAWPADVPDPEHPKHAAHALISGLNELGSSAQLRKRQELAKVQSMKFVQG